MLSAIQAGKDSIGTQCFCYQSSYSTITALQENYKPPTNQNLRKREEKLRFFYPGEITL